MVELTRPDILIVGIIVAVSIIALIVVSVIWIREKKLYGQKRAEVINSAKEVEHSPFTE